MGLTDQYVMTHRHNKATFSFTGSVNECVFSRVEDSPGSLKKKLGYRTQALWRPAQLVSTAQPITPDFGKANPDLMVPDLFCP